MVAPHLFHFDVDVVSITVNHVLVYESVHYMTWIETAPPSFEKDETTKCQSNRRPGVSN